MKEKQKQKTCLAVFVSAVVFLTGSLTALAYVPPQTMEFEFADYVPNSEAEHYFEEVDTNADPLLLYDCFWVNSDGTIEEIKDCELEVKGTCSHVYKDGKYSVHEKNSRGGCTITSWNAERCTKCGTVKIGDMINIDTYLKCIH